MSLQHGSSFFIQSDPAVLPRDAFGAKRRLYTDRFGIRRTSSLDSPLSTKLGKRETDGDSQLNLLKDRLCSLLPGSRWLTRDVLPSLSAILSPSFSAATTRLSPISSAHEPSPTRDTKDANEFGHVNSHFNVRRPSFLEKRPRSV
jgi:hypothetical protein